MGEWSVLGNVEKERNLESHESRAAGTPLRHGEYSNLLGAEHEANQKVRQGLELGLNESGSRGSGAVCILGIVPAAAIFGSQHSSL